MRLFWGLIETHMHTFDSSKWEKVCVSKRSRKSEFYPWDWVPVGSVSYHQNTCLTCGDLVERKMDRTMKINRR